MSELLKRQMLFTRLLPSLLDWCNAQPQQSAVVKEVYRPPEMVELYVQRGIGSRTSVHALSLAADIMLFRFDEQAQACTYLKDAADYADAGHFWKTLHPLCRWGGDFSNRKDGDHFSIESPEGHQ